ncbi:MAG TPA: LacI family DNA-binding transcriptional regulator [Kineosporiaceae bacterium]
MSSPPGRLTLADIARLAGVGLGTASRSLNNAPGVSPATRQRVLEVAERHSYVVSPEASKLAGGRTGRVAIVVPHLSRWFVGTIVEALASGFRAADLDVLLYQVGELPDRNQFFERLPARRKVDAVVVVGFGVEETERARLELLGVPVVAAGGRRRVYPHVGIDDEVAGRAAVDHLISLGHTAIAMITAADGDRPAPADRTLAYHRALCAAGIGVDERLAVTAGGQGGEQGAAAMAHLLSLPRRPTAVYAHSDEVALGAVRTIHRSGLRVPDDVSVVGIDDHPLAGLTDLTTVAQPVAEQGRRAAELTLALLRGVQPERESIILPTWLVIRRSTAPPGRATAPPATPG